MPYIRESYDTIRQSILDSIQYNMLNGQVPLANSPIRIIAEVITSALNSSDLFLDNLSIQFNPMTATGVYLDYWCILKGVNRKSAVASQGSVTFTGTTGTFIPAQTVLIASDGQTYTTDNAITVGQNVSLTATSIGQSTNQIANTILSLQAPISGVDSQLVLVNAITGGADLESDDALRVRMIQAYQAQLTGSTKADHIKQALAIPGVKSAWMPDTPKAGTEVTIWVMFDRLNVYQGYPQGTDGTASKENRRENATGDQLMVANALFDQKPYTEIQNICSPIRTPIKFEVSGLQAATATTQQKINDSITAVLHLMGDPNGSTVTLAAIDAAISGAAGTTSFTLVSPTADIITTTGQLPEIDGSVIFS